MSCFLDTGNWFHSEGVKVVNNICTFLVTLAYLWLKNSWYKNMAVYKWIWRYFSPREGSHFFVSFSVSSEQSQKLSNFRKKGTLRIFAWNIDYAITFIGKGKWSSNENVSIVCRDINLPLIFSYSLITLKTTRQCLLQNQLNFLFFSLAFKAINNFSVMYTYIYIYKFLHMEISTFSYISL